MVAVGAEGRRAIQPGHSITLQFGLGALAIVAAAFAVLLGIVTSQDERSFAQRHAREARRIASVMTGELSRLMKAGGGVDVWRTVSAEAESHGVLTGASRILVLAPDGTVKAGTVKSGTGTVGGRIAMKGNPDCPGCDSARLEDFPASAQVWIPGQGRHLRLVSAIPMSADCRSCHTSGGPVAGYVSMDFDLAGLDQSAVERRNSIVLVEVVSGLVLILLIAALFRRQVMRPVNELIVGAERLGAGDLGARVRIVGQNELSLLARHFNVMAASLQAQVARVEAASMESALLYTLVVETSRNLDTGDVALSVARVILERLRPRHVAFFLATANGGWVCAYGGGREPVHLDDGPGELLAALQKDDERMRGMKNGLPARLIHEACREGQMRMQRPPEGLVFVLPVVADTGLVGLLACVGVSGTVKEELLANLGAHLALAAANSFHYSGAITDNLTGLKNKRYGLARLDDAITAAQRYGTSLAVAMCDIDHFKAVNDTHGHPVGDEVLREIGARLARAVRKADIAIRYGGEEFLIILPQASGVALQALGEKIRRAIADAPVAVPVPEGALNVSISIGLALYDRARDSRDSLVARADAALYRAKQAGRNRIELSEAVAAPGSAGTAEPDAGR